MVIYCENCKYFKKDGAVCRGAKFFKFKKVVGISQIPMRSCEGYEPKQTK